ncbi:MAG: hypothetical protein GX286_04755 [Clostridiales bacterium]|jgi:hypothetical protein|nr:hypothetical protein [Clostridiales bacterium]
MDNLIFWAAWALAGIIMLVFYAKRKKSLKSTLFGMLTGVSALLLLHYFGGGLGYQPSLNLFNTMTALVLGVPGVIMMLIINIFL